MLHLIKMAAGIDSLEELAERQAAVLAQRRRLAPGTELMHVTRFFPKRADEILSPVGAQEAAVPGSLFWVFNKAIQARQQIRRFDEVEGDGGIIRCGIVLEGPLIRVSYQHRKAFQGWRYLEAADAPEDCGQFEPMTDVPHEMRQALRELCLI